MHQLTALARPADIEAHVYRMLQTDLFRRSYNNPCGYIRHWVTRFALVPRVFFEMTVPRIEHPHFTPWYGALHDRASYQNPWVHDCFLLHEITHATTLALGYDPTSDFETWSARITLNEQQCALESEVMVYGELPGLRRHTFDFPIWADRFLDARGALTVDRDRLFIERRRAMSDPDPSDSVEMQMASYPRQNRDWTEIWRARYREVEHAMARLVAESEHDRQRALDRYVRWLTEECGMTPERPYTFPDEAEAFATLFWANKARGLTADTGSGDQHRHGAPLVAPVRA